MFQFSSDDQLHPEFDKLLRAACQELPYERNLLGLLLLCYLAGSKQKPAINHVLLEGLNGVAKTTIVRALLRAIAGEALLALFALTDRPPYTRLQGGPDVSPADVVGYDLLSGALKFNPGPMLIPKPAHYFDELNRSPSKTQSCVLEPMAEGPGRVTLTTMDEDWRYRRTIRLPAFFMIASQNPDIQEGTFPLPEAGLDRFMVKITVAYTSRLAELVDDGEPEFRDDLNWAADALRRVLAIQAVRKPLGLPLSSAGPGFQSYAQWLRSQRGLASLLTAGPDWPPPGEMVKLLAEPPSASSVKLADEVEAVLTAQRHQELDRLRLGIRNTALGAGVPQFIADLVYNTWSEKAYREAVGGLSRNEPVPIPLIPDAPLEEMRFSVRQGASPRAAFALRDLSRALAYCTCPGGDALPVVRLEEVRRIAVPVLRHRVFLRFQDAARGVTSDDVVGDIANYLYVNRGGRLQ